MMHRNEDSTFDLDAALTALIDKYGSEVAKDHGQKKRKSAESDDLPEIEEEEENSGKKGKQQKTVHVVCEENRPIAIAIQEIAGIYFKNGDARKGGVFSKAAKAIRECDTELKNSKEAQKLKGVGKGIAGYIEEYINTGCIGKLEELTLWSST